MTAAADIDVPAVRAFGFVRREMGVSALELAARRRERALVRARALFVWAMRFHHISYARIGRAIDRDHSSIVHLLKVAGELRRVDPKFAAQCDSYAAEFGDRP